MAEDNAGTKSPGGGGGGGGAEGGEGAAAAKRETLPPGLHHHVVPTERAGALNVYVQGDLEEAHREKDSKCVFLTAHDVGCNHNSFMRFVDHEAFEEIKKRAIFVHVDMPGHEEGAADLETYPLIQVLGEELVTVLDQLRIKYVIGLGDGAGANIMARFAMMHTARCLGIILLHPTSNKATMVSNFKDKFSGWKVAHINPTAENLTLFRRFGHKLEEAEDKDKALQELKKTFEAEARINKRNMRHYMEAYSNRKDITPQLNKNLKCDALLLVGSKTSHVAAAEHMHSHMDKTKTSLLKIDEVGNVLEEAPVKLANAILLFCKGLGWLTSVTLPGVVRRSSTDSQGKPVRQRSISMEEYDKPNIRRLSITASSTGSNKD